MIHIHMEISENEVKNSLVLQDLYDYIQQINPDISRHIEDKEDAKADLVTWLTLGFTAWAALYPTIRDIQNWVRPKNYSISISDGTITTTATNLTIEEFLEVTKKIDKDKIKISVKK